MNAQTLITITELNVSYFPLSKALSEQLKEHCMTFGQEVCNFVDMSSVSSKPCFNGTHGTDMTSCSKQLPFKIVQDLSITQWA